ncbi:glycosyl hydrolase 108 family protein [Undibacterium sp. RTI2.1]|uniref:glycoside hydrolase family 108 protein n=1 Tax=unclassified Undibacterium TaxID=2630295 RepID=UPI002AB46E1A|nr:MULTISPECIES: glycosyl hydrolase 108 family protein [unclassified Undibacterium]MDY7537628.1 glycosyl hydrolase 108 family protein [Undibacterium sp. 5I1]MEB0029229.1 glycosyl hydrolase 108 family protein [Undibacterium sp. RTI2.1]MEB0115537.1 glycosyl hydrolase 108 family protein [Undibacterium sp. RTI2.2]MEB0230173.1 glycosyl hydrolase 108 family protein [Undibacterium sp. 10I3]MEB0256365.1 glycosyl hydrolase 108 family protein [Undibacterium sp. 5I1]
MNFDICVYRLLGNEGRYVNDSRDPGGETNWGISKRSYPSLDIKNLTKAQAAAIYKRDFWDPIQLDKAPLGVANQLLDFAVNSGLQTAIRALQRAVGVADDGILGNYSKQAIAKMQLHDIIMRLIAERILFMTNCKNWDSAGKGWMRRIAHQLQYGADDV